MKSTAIRIRTLREDDLVFADRARAQAGWNQMLTDWQRLLALEPDGCFLAEIDGHPVGTATTTVYGDADLAWIGMVLVEELSRRRGVGGSLLEHAIAYLRDEREVACIKLDATPAGQALYEKLGFVAEWGLRRWQATVPGRGSTAMVDDTEREFSAETLEFDQRAFGADRSALLNALATDALSICRSGSGYGILRAGSKASYLGPVLASSWAEARGLIESLLASAPAGGIFWDIPDHCEEAIQFAEESGFAEQRQLVRMALGGAKLNEDPQSVFAIAEPALG